MEIHRNLPDGLDSVQVQWNFLLLFLLLIALVAGALQPADFVTAADGLAHASTDRIIYNNTTGALLYDADGDQAGSVAVQFAVLSGVPTLAGTDFIVV